MKVRPFKEAFSQEEIDKVDEKILEKQRKMDAKLYSDSLNAKDFPMNN